MRAIASPVSRVRDALRGASRAAAALGACGWLAVGCATLPGATSAWRVQSVVPRGAYLDVSFSADGSVRRFYTAANETCRSMLRAEATVQYVKLGPLGRFKAGDAQCVPMGIGSLSTWRDARPRPAVGPLPSKKATFQLVYEDADVLMARGLFALLPLIGWPGMGDTIAVLPRSPVCEAIVPSGVATIQYRDSGPDVFTLFDGDRRCVIEGLIQPVGER